MGLRETFTNAAKTVFTAVGDIPEACTYYSRGADAYDASTGVVSTTVSTVVANFVFFNYNKSQIDGEHVEPADVKATIPQANISSIVPNVDDYLMRIEAGASVRYDVVGVEQDPAAALWNLQVRKP